jgi:hypothetical protein
MACAAVRTYSDEVIDGDHPTSGDLGLLEPGTHLCAFAPDADRLDRIASTFVGQGLAAGDQLMYVASDAQADAVLAALPSRLDARTAIASGQLRILSFPQVYGSSRPGDLSVLADGFREVARQALASGFPGLRVAARMDDLPDLLGSAEEVVRWERLSTGMQRELGVSSVCLYDDSRLEPASVASIAREHCGLAPELGEAPLATFLAVGEPWGLRVSGEVDVSNRDLLHRLLVSRAAVTPRLRVDLSGLTFADVGTVARLRAIADALPEGGWLALDRVPDLVRRVLDVTGLGHERMRLEP